MKITHRVRRGLISRFVLEKLSEAGELALDGLFPKNRAEGRLWRELLGLPTGYEFSKQTLSTTLNRLKSQGLVKNSGGRRYRTWLATEKGKSKIKFYGYHIKPAKPDGIPRLVMYDIPESERKRRDWLRTELVACEYQPLQRSVWLGYSPLPEEFILSLQNLNLKNKVHIVSIHKTGTLNEF